MAKILSTSTVLIALMIGPFIPSNAADDPTYPAYDFAPSVTYRNPAIYDEEGNLRYPAADVKPQVTYRNPNYFDKAGNPLKPQQSAQNEQPEPAGQKTTEPKKGIQWPVRSSDYRD